jgi:hypothetical protein
MYNVSSTCDAGQGVCSKGQRLRVLTNETTDVTFVAFICACFDIEQLDLTWDSTALCGHVGQLVSHLQCLLDRCGGVL